MDSCSLILRSLIAAPLNDGYPQTYSPLYVGLDHNSAKKIKCSAQAPQPLQAVADTVPRRPEGELLVAGSYQELLALLAETGAVGVDDELHDRLPTLVADSQRR